MSTSTNDPTSPNPFLSPARVWVGALILAAIAVSWTIPTWLAPRSWVAMIAIVAAPLLGAIAAVVWWTFAANVRGPLRWGVPALLFVPLIGLSVTLHRGNEMILVLYGLTAALAVWLGWVLVSVPFPAPVRRYGVVAGLIAMWVVVGFVKINGTDADMNPHVRWRWQLSDEERFLAEKSNTSPKPTEPTNVPLADSGRVDWPGFRGALRNSVFTGANLDPDWSARSPQLVWKKRVGPGWGSFAVAGGNLYTQEQRGADEVVVCYRASNGDEFWEYKTPARFEEAISGPGPRATPTVHGSRLYVQGATGKVHCLDIATGQPRWTADLVALGGTMPQWGFAASPFISGNLVIVYSGSGKGKGIAALSSETGELVWQAGNATHSYSSVHPAEIGGVPQVLLLSDYGLESFRPTDGEKLWESQWKMSGNRATQPVVVSDSDVMIGTGVGSDQGIRRIRATKVGDSWEVKTIWSTRGARPYFNDGVALGGHFYGFDDGRFCCVDLANGKQGWKDTAYGHGQVLALADQGLLLVQTESGPVALVEAKPDDFVEIAKFPALTGKTWNHPVVAHGHLYVRNGQEAACLRLPTK